MQAVACAFHVQREAIGVCIACRSRVCAECTTKVEGINYCVQCLARLARRDAAPQRDDVQGPSRTRVIVGSVVWAALLWLLVWALLHLAFPEAA